MNIQNKGKESRIAGCVGRAASEEKIQNRVSQGAMERLSGKAGRRNTAQLLVMTMGHLLNNHHNDT